MIVMTNPALSRVIALVLTLSLLGAGCGGGGGGGVAAAADDSRLVNDVVDDFNEARMDARKSTQLFAAGKMPAKAEFKKYGPLSYWPNLGAPTISGDTATMKVSVRNEITGDDVGMVVWTFVKEAEGWKIQSAPLP